MRPLLWLGVLLLICSPVFAQTGYVSDVPAGHYAYDAVYDLIRQGITSGFPDGTFRGRQLMTRYELAVFMQKFVRARALASGSDEKLLAELASETSLVKYERDKENKETKYYLNLSGLWRGGEASGQTGEQTAYRLRGGVVKNFDDVVGLKIDLDTLDSGFAGGSRDLVREMLAFEGKIDWGRQALKLTTGPGDVMRAPNPLFPADNNTYFRRPRTGIAYSLAIGRADLTGELLSRAAAPTGQLSTCEANVALTLNWPSLKLSARPRLFYDQTGARDLRLELGGEYRPSDFLSGSLLVGLAKSADWPHGLFAKGSVALFDLVTLTAQRVGSQYRQRVGYGIFDLFDRNLVDGSTSLGLSYQQNFTGGWFASAAADQTTPSAVTTTSWRVGRKLGEAADWALVCQTLDAAYSVGWQADFQL